MKTYSRIYFSLCLFLAISGRSRIWLKLNPREKFPIYGMVTWGLIIVPIGRVWLLLFLRILIIFQSHHDLEVRDNQSLKFKL